MDPHCHVDPKIKRAGRHMLPPGLRAKVFCRAVNPFSGVLPAQVRIFDLQFVEDRCAELRRGIGRHYDAEVVKLTSLP